MNEQRRLGRRELATRAATVPIGVAALGLTSAPGLAAAPALQATPLPVSDRSLVYVSGHGSIRVPPDIASVVIGIDVERPTLTEAQAEATALAAEIIDVIEGAGVAPDDIRTASFTVRMVRERNRGDDDDQRRETKGFQVSNAVEVTVRDLDALGQLLDDAIAAGANEVRQIAFSLANPAAAAGQARARAMEDARSRAEELAAAAGLALSRVVTISETFSPGPTPIPFASANVAEMAMADASAAPVPIAVGTDEVVVKVQVAYELG